MNNLKMITIEITKYLFTSCVKGLIYDYLGASFVGGG